MRATDNGGPAFPVSTGCNDGHLGHQDSQFTWQFPGMTLRDYFAAKAMQPLIRCVQNNGKTTDESDGEFVSRVAYLMADAMLKAREA